MQQFIGKYHDRITRVLSGLDRLYVRATGTSSYQKHVQAVSDQIKNSSLQPFRKRGLPVEYVSSPSLDKDELARNGDLQALLYDAPPATAIEQRRRSAAVSRKLRVATSAWNLQDDFCTHRYVAIKAGLEIHHRRPDGPAKQRPPTESS